MAVREGDVQVAVVVGVEEQGAPPQRPEGRGRHARAHRVLEEERGADSLVEGVVVVREVRDHQVGEPVFVRIRGGHPHASLCRPVGAERDPGEQAGLPEATAAVLEHVVRTAVVGHKDVLIAVVVEVERDGPHGVARRNVSDSGRVACILERAVPPPAEKAVGLRNEAARAVEHRDPPAPAPGPPSVPDVRLVRFDVVGDE